MIKPNVTKDDLKINKYVVKDSSGNNAKVLFAKSKEEAIEKWEEETELIGKRATAIQITGLPRAKTRETKKDTPPIKNKDAAKETKQ